ncbi:MAG: acyl-CoA thioesterase [Candidatus Latescibacteria bacterium]|nr:acyl-CoA thioesterase [Candidatus Latescibacterota bacterium]
MTVLYRTRRVVEFADTDMAGIVHFSRFFVFMEQTEHAFWRARGLSVHLERDGQRISWPRLDARCNFQSPVRFEDELEVIMRLEGRGRSSLTYAFDFVHGARPVAQGQLKVACCRCEPEGKMHAIPIPPFLDQHLQQSEADRV